MKFLLFITMIAMLSHQTEKETGGISGTVFDGTNHKPLNSILVNILGTTHQKLTNDSGSFEFKDLTPRIYEIEFKSIWYRPLKLENIELKVGEPTVRKISLARNEIDGPIAMDSDVRGEGGARSNMLIVKPDPRIDYKILIIKPDSTIDYK